MTSLFSRRHLVLAGASAVAAVLAPAALAQQDFPNKGLRIVVPFTAGGSSDVQARMLAERLGRLYKQPVVVDNRPGAGGHIGGKSVVDAPADGYTLMLGSIGLHATYGVYKKLPYDPSTDFKVLTVLAEMPHVIVATPGLPAGNVQELVALARKQPGALNFGSAGVGSSVHMIGELFKVSADAPMTHVPYRRLTLPCHPLKSNSLIFYGSNAAVVDPTRDVSSAYARRTHLGRARRLCHRGAGAGQAHG